VSDKTEFTGRGEGGEGAGCRGCEKGAGGAKRAETVRKGCGEGREGAGGAERV
jgi:hypothetical protein